MLRGGGTSLKRQAMALALGLLMVVSLVASFAGVSVAAVGSGTFVDDDGNIHEANIELIAAAGITVGCDAVNHLYCPDGAVTRGQMVTFLIRALGELPSATYHGYFPDVPGGQWYTGYVERSKELGIADGFGDGTFRPDDPVTRAEAAAFLLRALGEGGNLPVYQGYFNDAPAGAWYTGYAERLYELGLTKGCALNPLRYCGDKTVRRDEIASFLARAFLLTPTTTTTTSGGGGGTLPPVNDPPAANDDEATTLASAAVTINVTANDVDVNLLVSSVTNTTVPAHGTLGNNHDGSFEYTPEDGYLGDDTFEYEVCDTGALCDTATVTIHVVAFVSDDFYGSDTIDTSLWTEVDPVGDATFGISDTENQVVISLPWDSARNAYADGNSSARLMQPADDVDFTLEVKFQSQVVQPQQDQGILIQEDADTFLRFDVYAAPGAAYASQGEAHVFAAFVDDPNPPTAPFNTAIPAGDPQPLWLRVTRVGDDWTFATSTDGSTFIDAGTLTQAMTVTQVGVYAANPPAAGIPAPEFRSVVDYFFNDAAPIDPEDGGLTIFDIWYGDSQQFGNIGTAQKWIDILGNVDDSDGIKSLAFSLNGVDKGEVSLGPDPRRLLMPGDFDAEIWSGDGTTAADSDLNLGDINTVVLTAIDNDDNVTTKIVTFTWNTGTTWSLPYSTTWSGAVQDAVQVVDGNWEIVGGQLHPVEIGYDRLVDIGQGIDPGAWDSYTVEVPIKILGLDTVNGYSDSSFAPGLGILMGWDGHESCSTFSYTSCPWTPGAQPAYGWWPMGSLGELRWIAGAEGEYITDNKAAKFDEISESITIGATYTFKMQVAPGAGGPFYSLKIWEGTGTDPSPGSWDLQYPATEDPIVAAGSFLLLVHHVDVLIGNVTVTPYSP